jgi:CRP-like cAMP-binding protein
MDQSSLLALPGYLSEVLGRISLTEAIGYAGILLAIGTSAMRTMIPLRSMSLAANAVFLVYGLLTGLAPTAIVNALLLPVNAIRLAQMIRLVRRVERAASSDLSMDWLKPYMNPRSVCEGEVLFAKGDAAGCLYYILRGRYRLRESGRELGPGELVGELAFVAPDRCRTQSLECIEAGAMLTISYEDLAQLYYQNPSFGFYFLGLTTGRLMQNITELEAEVEALRGVAAPTRAPQPLRPSTLLPQRRDEREPQGLPSAPSPA